MKARTWTLTAALGLLCLAGPAAAQLAPALEYVWGKNLEAFNKEDGAGVMATIDTRSPDFGPTSAALDALFKDRDQKAQLLDFVLMGHDDEFAVARVKTRTTDKPGSGFTNNVVDAIVVFHQENGDWKLWSEQILGVQILP